MTLRFLFTFFSWKLATQTAFLTVQISSDRCQTTEAAYNPHSDEMVTPWNRLDLLCILESVGFTLKKYLPSEGALSPR